MNATEYARKKRKVVNLITSTFSDVRYPGDMALLHSRHADADGEIVSFRGKPWNKAWRGVPCNVIEENYSSLLFFSAEAFRFYLPAYMTCALKPPQDSPQSKVLPFTLYSLNPDVDNQDFLESFLTQIEGFTTQQEEAVELFLELIRDEHHDRPLRREASQALERYWGKNRSKEGKMVYQC